MKTTLIRKLVELPRTQIERYTRRHPEVSVIWEGLVVKEFIESHGIVEVSKGVREFYAFKRQQVNRLGLKAAS